MERPQADGEPLATAAGFFQHRGSGMAFPFSRPRGPKKRRPAFLHLEALEDRTLPSVTTGLAFPGNQSLQNIHDADTVVAANANYVVEISNDTLGIWNKSTGQLVSQQTLASFWNPVQPTASSPGFYYDVTGAWDDQANRWVLGTLYRVPTNPQVNNQLFAVSNSADPTAGFSEMQSIPVLETSPTLGTIHGDFPLLGYNADEYTIAMNMNTTPGGAAGVKILTIPKGPALDANPSTFTYYQTDLKSPNYYWEPAVMNDANLGDPQWFAQIDPVTKNTLDLIKETNELSSSPTFSSYKMTIPAFGAIVRSPQPGTANTIDTGTTTYLSVAQRGNRIVVAQEVGTNGVTQARWYDFNVGGATPQLTQWGQLNPGPGIFTYDAGVNIAPNGDLGFTYMQSSASQYMSMYVTAQEAGAPAGVTDTPVPVVPGTVPYMSVRNGDYTGVVIDPVTGGFWAAAEYAFPGSPSVTNNWATYITSFATASATHLAISASPTTAGAPTSVTVTALNGLNAVAKGFTGTVHFASSDLGAGLPSDYTFTAADNGQHTFSIPFAAVGNTILTVTTNGSPSVSGSQTIAVSPGAASSLAFSGLSATPAAGTPQSVTITAYDGSGNVATGYTGTVHFSSLDPQAILPGDYTFSAADAGRHTFYGVIFQTTGALSLQAADTGNGSLMASQDVTVGPGSAPPSAGDTLTTALATGLGSQSGTYSTTAALGNDAEGAADVQMYAFQAALGSTLNVATTTPSGGNPMTAYLRLFDVNGNELANSGAGTTLAYTFAASRTYYLGVSGSPNTAYSPTVAGSGVPGSTGDYHLDATLTSTPNVGDTLSTALATNLGPASGSYSNTATLGGGAAGAADVDLYRFQVGTGSTITASTATPTGGTAMTAYLRLFDANGNELANSGGGNSLSYTFAAGGTYYLGVSGSPNTAYNPNVAGSGVTGTTGDYQLSASLSSPALSINNVSVTKPFSGSTNAVFTVSLSTASAQTVTVNYALSAGTARANTDFTNVANGTLTFTPGQLTQTITVPIPGNAVRTGPRTFFVNLSGASNATVAASQGVGTIVDPNPLPTITVTGASTSEGSSGSKTLSFTVKLSAASAQEVTLQYATADGTAVAGTDYKAASGLLVFYPGDTSETVPITVFGYPGKNSDQSFTLNVSSPTNAVILAGQGVGTILNANNTVSVTGATVVNGTSGTTPVTFTINLSSPVPAGAPPVVVQYATANGTSPAGVAGVDYVANTGSVTFNPGDSSKTVTVLALGTPQAQSTRSFVLNITGASNATVPTGTKATGTILNNNAQPTVSVGNATAAEVSSGNKTATFTVNLSAASGQTITVQYATADGSAVAGTDYTAASGTLTFAPGVTSKTVAVTVLAGSAIGPSKNFTLNLSNPTNATLGGSQGTGTIVEAGTLPTLSINNVTASQGNTGTKAFTFSVTLSPAVPTGGQPVTVQYATADGSAVAGTDYTATSGTLTFTPGVTTRTVTVTVLGNPARVGDSNFTLNLSNPANAAILAGQGIGTIVNGNNTVSVTNATVTNGPSGSVTPVTFTINLSTPVPVNGPPVVVQYATANGTSPPGVAGTDYVAASGSVTFNPGDSSKTVTVYALGTALNQATKTFLLNITGAANATVPTNTRATGTILTGAAAPLVNVSDAVVGEPTSGTRTLTFTVSLSAASGQTVTVQYATADGTALAGTDYAAASGTLTFKPGVTSQTVTITVYGDLNIDPDQILYLNLMNATNAGLGRNRGTGTILNDYQ
jgi:hypothetical protein